MQLNASMGAIDMIATRLSSKEHDEFILAVSKIVFDKALLDEQMGTKSVILTIDQEAHDTQAVKIHYFIDSALARYFHTGSFLSIM